MSKMDFITVLDVCRSLGVEPYPRLIRAVRRSASTQYRKLYDKQTPKTLLTKTDGGYRRWSAVFPEDFRSIVEDAIRARPNEPARQPDLFP